MMKIINSIRDMKLQDMKSYETYYAKQENCSFVYTAYAGESRMLCITDLTNAMKRGVCEHYEIEMVTLDSICTEAFEKIFQDMGAYKEYMDKASAERYREFKASTVFSPFAKMNPVKKIPNKWTLRHLKNLVANGQIIRSYKDGHYTDDYAYDASVNYGKGDTDTLELIRKVVERPSGWWIGQKEIDENGIIALSLNCYYFDSNTIYVDLNKK